MDIAAGNGLGSKLPGVAPEADLVFVEASAIELAGRVQEGVGQSLGESVPLLEAINFVFETAGDRPCVVNVSLGTYGGPHDGSSLVEQGMDAIVTRKPNRAVVVAAGNSQQHGIHSAGQVPATGDSDLIWRIPSQAGGEFQLWYAGESRLWASLIGPDGTNIATVMPDENQTFTSGGKVGIFVSSRLKDPNKPG